MWYISLSTVTAIAGIIFLTISATESFPVFDIFASIFLFPSIIAVFGINIYTWKKGLPEPLTFNKMVKTELDDFFNKINHYYTNRTEQGVQLKTIDGHFWLELHFSQSRKIPNSEFFGDEFYEV